MTSSSTPRVAVVTGAARGIGLATAQWFLGHGYQVALVDNDAATLAQTDKQFNNPDKVLAVNCDVSKPEQVAQAVKTIAARFGRVDALVNNAGSTEAGLTRRVHAILDSHQLDYDLEWEHSPSYITPRGNLVEAISAAIVQSYGVTPELSTTGGTSDGRFIADICPQVIEFGPLNATIHKLNECVAVADIEPLKETYKLTMQTLLSNKV